MRPTTRAAAKEAGTEYVDRSEGTYRERLVAMRAPVRVTTARERAAATAFHLDRAAVFSCALCGKFAFPKPTICFWCDRNL